MHALFGSIKNIEIIGFWSIECNLKQSSSLRGLE